MQQSVARESKFMEKRAVNRMVPGKLLVNDNLLINEKPAALSAGCLLYVDVMSLEDKIF